MNDSTQSQQRTNIEYPYWPFTRVVCWVKGHDWREEIELEKPEEFCKRCGRLSFR